MTPSRSISATTITWAALAVTLAHLGLVLIDDGGQLPAPLPALRTLLSLPVLFVPGLPVALLAYLRPRGARGQAKQRDLGAITLLSLALAFSLVLDYCVAEVVRSLAPPVTGRLLSLIALGGAGAAFLLLGYREAPRISLEPGLSPWPLLAALALVLGFAFFAHQRLYTVVDQFVLVPHPVRAITRERLEDPGRFKPTLISGARRKGPEGRRDHGWLRPTGAQVLYKLSNTTSTKARTLVGFAVTAPLNTRVQLWRVAGARCGVAGGTARPEQRLAEGLVPGAVLGLKLAPLPTFNTVIAAPLELPPGATCLALRVPGQGRAALIFAEVSHDLFLNAPLLGGRLQPVSEATIETHLSGVHYRASMAQRNEIGANALLWGYFTQMVVEQLAGDKGLAQGATFLLFCLLAFSTVLLTIGAASADPRAAALKTRHSLIAGLLLLGPLFSQIYSQTFAIYRSLAFPDTVYTFFIMSAIAMLVQRNRVGFILLGCLGAFARYPGAYVLVVALIAWLVFYKQDRAWTWRTLVWAAGAGLLVVALLLAHFSSTIGVKAFAYAAYFEVFPEHFQVFKQADPAWFRITCFFSKLALLSGLTILLWPLAREAVSKLLIAVTLGYAVTLMAVHLPHMHYFPILIYCTAAAGLRAVALRGRLLTTALAVVLVTVGTALAVQVNPLLNVCIGCFSK